VLPIKPAKKKRLGRKLQKENSWTNTMNSRRYENTSFLVRKRMI
jgi:hypothetical protein